MTQNPCVNLAFDPFGSLLSELERDRAVCPGHTSNQMPCAWYSAACSAIAADGSIGQRAQSRGAPLRGLLGGHNGISSHAPSRGRQLVSTSEEVDPDPELGQHLLEPEQTRCGGACWRDRRA
jgi:hypothetical protein